MTVDTDDLDVKDAEPTVEEEKAFNAATDSLFPEPPENPLERKVETEEAAAKKYFLGEMTEEDVLARLQKLDELEKMEERISSRLFGKIGEVNRDLQSLKEKEFRFDPEKLVKVKELDESIANALSEDLSAALAGQQFDREGITQSLKESLLGDVNPYVEERLLFGLVPDIDEIKDSDEFKKWFFEKAPDTVRDTFKAWDDGTKYDGVAMARAFAQFKDYRAAQEAQKATKRDVLESGVEERKGKSSTSTRRPMSEEEAFNARLKENNS